MWFLFAVVGIPIVFTMLVWVLVTAWRVLHPDEGRPIDKDPRVHRLRRIRAGREMEVYFEDIRMLERERVETVPPRLGYRFDDGYSTGLPPEWIENLNERRN
ncbi:MAG: hypothetical protein HKN17_00305 [Rhodothermales bacterium]|nr:hypothetical protein [Rhodothermales bacterium]